MHWVWGGLGIFFVRVCFFSPELMNVFEMLLPHPCKKVACQMLDSYVFLLHCWSGLTFCPWLLLLHSLTVLLAGAVQRVMCLTTLVLGWCCLVDGFQLRMESSLVIIRVAYDCCI